MELPTMNTNTMVTVTSDVKKAENKTPPESDGGINGAVGGIEKASNSESKQRQVYMRLCYRCHDNEQIFTSINDLHILTAIYKFKQFINTSSTQ